MPEDPEYTILREAFETLQRSRRRVDAIVDKAMLLTLRLSRPPQIGDFAPLLDGHSLTVEERKQVLSYLKILMHDDDDLT